MPAIAMSPAAGAHGEFCGLMTIRAALIDRGERERIRMLVPESAHGTNPASAAACGFTVDSIPVTARGRVDVAALKAKLGNDVAGMMLTNPNTCGLFEDEILEIADAIHGAGGLFYCDGANFNAIVGRVRVADRSFAIERHNIAQRLNIKRFGTGQSACLVIQAPRWRPRCSFIIGKPGIDSPTKPVTAYVAHHWPLPALDDAIDRSVDSSLVQLLQKNAVVCATAALS